MLAARSTFLVLLSLALGCDVDGVTLPDDFNALKNKVVTVQGGADLGAVAPLTSLQGAGVRDLPVHGDADQSSRYTSAAVDWVRIPGGYPCEYTLGAVFANAQADATTVGSYDFRVVDGLLDRIPKGTKVVYQALWDVGACTVDPAGQPVAAKPKDAGQWAKVVVGLLKHFRGPTLAAGDPFIATARDYPVTAVEFPEDPLGAAGYASAADVATDFMVLSGAVKAAFPNDAQGRPSMMVVGPSIAVASADAAAVAPVKEFVQHLKQQGRIAELDALSYQSVVTHPRTNGAIAVALRAMLDAEGLTALPLWNTRYEPAIPKAEAPDPDDAGSVARWSARVGAFAVASRMAWQGGSAAQPSPLERAFLYRGDRVDLGIGSPLWAPDGSVRPGGLALQAWARLLGQTRVQVDAVASEDSDGLVVLATKSNDAICDGEPAGPRILVLMANSNVHLGQSQITYQLTVADAGTGSNEVRVKVRSLDAGSRADASTSQFDCGVEERVRLVDGAFFKSIPAVVPSVQFVEIRL